MSKNRQRDGVLSSSGEENGIKEIVPNKDLELEGFEVTLGRNSMKIPEVQYEHLEVDTKMPMVEFKIGVFEMIHKDGQNKYNMSEGEESKEPQMKKM